MSMYFSNINFWAVLVATLASFALGGWWYSPKGFGRAWLAAIGKSPNELGSPVVAMTLTFFSTFLTAIILAILLNSLQDHTLLLGARLGFVLGVGLVATSMFSDYLFSGSSLELFLIQVGYRVLLLTIMGGIIGVWG